MGVQKKQMLKKLFLDGKTIVVFGKTGTGSTAYSKKLHKLTLLETALNNAADARFI